MSPSENKFVRVNCRRKRVSAVLDVLRSHPDAIFRICHGKLSRSGARLDILFAGQHTLIEEVLSSIRNLGVRAEIIPMVEPARRTALSSTI